MCFDHLSDLFRASAIILRRLVLIAVGWGLLSGVVHAEDAAGQLNTQTWWFGNTWGGGSGPKARYVPQNIDGLCVMGERVYLITQWDEHSSEGAIFSTSGEKITVPEADGDWNAQFHSWGYSGSAVVASDGTQVFYGMGQNGEANKGEHYVGVARYDLEGKASPWPTAANSNRLILKDEKDKPTGLAVMDDELFVACSDGIRVYGTKDMDYRRTVPCASPGALVVEPVPASVSVQGTAAKPTVERALWVIDRTAKTVRRMARDGRDLGPVIRDCKDPVALCFTASGDLLVADGALDRQRIQRYRGITGVRVPGADFGSPIYTGATPGAVVPGKFYALRGIACGADDSLYVASSDYGARLTKYDAQRKMVWTRQGTEFVSCGDADPGHDSSVFSAGHRYEIDYSKAPGAGWRDAAITVDPLRYPNDPRLKSEMWQSMRMLRIADKPFMFGRVQMGGDVYVWRFDGNIAVPAAMLRAGNSKPEIAWPPAHPNTPFLWTDRNGDGDMQADEYTAVQDGLAQIASNGSFLLNVGGWDAGRGAIVHIPVGPLTPQGVPTWNVAGLSQVTIPTSTNIKNLSKMFYDAARDRMYLGVWTEAHPFPGGGWEQMGTGPVLQCFETWSTAPKFVWETLLLPPEGMVSNAPKSWSFEKDYAFVASTWKHEQIAVDVYRLSDGQRVGRLLPTAEIGGVTGWADMNDSVQSHQRSDGSYLIFMEEVWMAKGIFWQWNPRLSSAKAVNQKPK